MNEANGSDVMLAVKDLDNKLDIVIKHLESIKQDTSTIKKDTSSNYLKLEMKINILAENILDVRTDLGILADKVK